ncbi:YfhO family protein, partial [Streptococcus pyogenes]
VVLLAFAFRPKKFVWVLLMAMTFLELGCNAYLSQVTLGYADAYKFSDATISVKRVTDTIKDNNTSGFYRIAGSFAYSRTSPTLLNYPGLSTFSSSLERTTMDHFAYMGDYG